MSEPSDSDDNLVFHYSREQRLSRAPEKVRALNEAGPRKRPNLFRTLTATRGSSLLLLAILILSATVLITHYLLPAPNTAVLQGNRLTLQAFRFEDAIYIKLKKKQTGNSSLMGPVAAAIRLGKTGPIQNREFRFTAQGEEEFRFSIPSEAGQIDLSIVLKSGDSVVVLKAVIE